MRFSSLIYISSFQERQPAPITSFCYHDAQSDHFSPLSSPSPLPPHWWTALQWWSCPSLRHHLAYPSQGHLQPHQWHPQPVGPCCQRGLLSPPLRCSLCTPSHPLGLLWPANQRGKFSCQPRLRQNCLGCSNPGLQGLWGRWVRRQGLHWGCSKWHVDSFFTIPRCSTPM